MIQKIFINWNLLLIFLLVVANPNISWGEDVYTIRNNGDSANRIDIVILGDGYTASELTDYANDVEDFMNRMFQQEPFYEYATYFNVHRIDVISNESGADHPTQDIYKDTALDATYNCAEIARLLCVNISKVQDILINSDLIPNQQDTILVIVNDPEYGGSGGYIAVSSTHPLAVDLILHELGHSFGHLGDEYDSGDCDNTYEPPSPNVTKETNRNLIKWNVGGGPPTGWIELSTPIPTTSTTPGVPGLYEGAQYCVTGLYRPTYNSKMRALGFPFEQINEEQLVKRIYNLVSPLDFYNPLDNDLRLFLEESLEFSVGVLQPASHFLDVIWHVDDVSKGIGNEFTLDSSKNLNIGIHTVEAIIQDTTFRVRNDPEGVLTESHSWQVTIESRDQKLIINASVGGTTDPAPGTYSYDAGTDVAITATPDTHYDFSYWSGDVPQGNENDNPITITMASDKSITANFVLKQYTLTIAAGAGGTTDPAPGTYSYNAGTDVAITAIPDIGYGLTGWSGDASGTGNPITITMDADKSITASFIRQYTLMIAAGDGGTTDPAPGSYTYDPGTEVTIEATPISGYRFIGWTGDIPADHENDNPITITMDSDKTITANFIQQYTLTIAAGTGGTTDPIPGSHPCDSGEQVSITAVPSSGYQFSGWSGDASGTATTITINMNSDKSITASFTAIPPVNGDGGGTKKGCFIATAAYGSDSHIYVHFLRDFRDKYLMHNEVGRTLIGLYYKYSPFLSNFIVKHKVLKIAVRINLLPLVVFSYSMLHFGPIMTVIMLVFIFMLPIFLISFFWRRLRRVEAKD